MSGLRTKKSVKFWLLMLAHFVKIDQIEGEKQQAFSLNYLDVIQTGINTQSGFLSELHHICLNTVRLRIRLCERTTGTGFSNTRRSYKPSAVFSQLRSVSLNIYHSDRSRAQWMSVEIKSCSSSRPREQAVWNQRAAFIQSRALH